jgi:hypothetical protein
MKVVANPLLSNKEVRQGGHRHLHPPQNFWKKAAFLKTILAQTDLIVAIF